MGTKITRTSGGYPGAYILIDGARGLAWACESVPRIDGPNLWQLSALPGGEWTDTFDRLGDAVAFLTRVSGQDGYDGRG
jgi:hypothetical protein